MTTHDRAHPAGWAALAAGRWSDARDLFERAAADGADPEGLEGLSWAAWWMDDTATLFEARGESSR